MLPRARPLFIFDGGCAFCARWVERWKASTRGAVEFAPYQELASSCPELTLAHFREAAQLIETDGTVHSGAAAVFRMLWHGGSRVLPALYAREGAFASAADRVYRVVARRRTLASRLTRALVGVDVRRPTFFLTRWAFLRSLGLVSLAAFISFGRQASGLIGARGIAPASEFLDHVREAVRDAGWGQSAIVHLAPTLVWIAPSDGMVNVVVGIGVAASIALVVDVAPAIAIAVIWVAYLSLTTIGSVFMHYQWDGLLLETCITALFLAPWRLRPRLLTDRPPTTAGLWLLRLLLFKLMFLSGIVKRLSDDPTWKNLTALQYHYWTQPLPLWTSWYANQLPPRVQSACTWAVLAIEVCVPFVMLVPRTPRYVAFVAFVLVQLAIAATGNYGFFNALTIVLALVLLDDGVLARVSPRAIRARLDALRSRPSTRAPRSTLTRLPVAAAAVTVGLMSISRIVSTLDDSFEAPAPLAALAEWAAPFDSISSYGLFAVMTTHRPEIEVDGSADGVTWHPYLFRWKPNPDVTEPPRFDLMDMPRLDWQMWFAALSGRCDHAPWYLAFMRRLLEGSPEVVALLAGNPFPRAPPRFVRSRLFEAQFTSAAERHATGAWWKRREAGVFCPALTLHGGELTVANVAEPLRDWPASKSATR